jgi:transposase-like protein
MMNVRIGETPVDDPCVCPRCGQPHGKRTNALDSERLDRYLCESCGQVWVVKRQVIDPAKAS